MLYALVFDARADHKYKPVIFGVSGYNNLLNLGFKVAIHKGEDKNTCDDKIYLPASHKIRDYLLTLIVADQDIFINLVQEIMKPSSIKVSVIAAIGGGVNEGAKPYDNVTVLQKVDPNTSLMYNVMRMKGIKYGDLTRSCEHLTKTWQWQYLKKLPIPDPLTHFVDNETYETPKVLSEIQKQEVDNFVSRSRGIDGRWKKYMLANGLEMVINGGTVRHFRRSYGLTDDNIYVMFWLVSQDEHYYRHHPEDIIKPLVQPGMVYYPDGFYASKGAMRGYLLRRGWTTIDIDRIWIKVSENPHYFANVIKDRIDPVDRGLELLTTAEK